MQVESMACPGSFTQNNKHGESKWRTTMCGKCGTKTTKPEAYGDYTCSKSGCDGHLAYYVELGFSPAPIGKVHVAAVPEIEGNDKVLAKAVAMVFNQSARGRTTPGTTMNYIHVGEMRSLTCCLMR